MADNGKRPPFFIVGSGRSGSTLLQVLIDAHPDIAVPPESHIYNRFGPMFATFEDLAEQRNRARFIGALLRDAYIRRWRLDATVEEVERRVTRRDRRGVIEALFGVYTERHGATRWGDKTPEHVRCLPRIIADFPDAKLIHLVRDGRDVAEAYRRMIYGSFTAVGLARDWRYEVMLWQAFCDEHGTNNTLVVRYEDLVTAPRETVNSIFEFIGERHVDTVSTYSTTNLSQNLGAEPWHGSLRKSITSGKIGVYRKKFTAREIEVFESIAGDALEVYGYERDFPAPRNATVGETVTALVTDRGIRWYRKLFQPRTIWLAVEHWLRMARHRTPQT